MPDNIARAGYGMVSYLGCPGLDPHHYCAALTREGNKPYWLEEYNTCGHCGGLNHNGDDMGAFFANNKEGVYTQYCCKCRILNNFTTCER